MEFYSFRDGRPRGKCRVCYRTYKRIFDSKAKQTRVAERIQAMSDIPAPAETPASVPTVAQSTVVVPSDLKARQLEIVQALRVGAGMLNANAQQLLETLLRYAQTPTHPHHEWAFKFIVERLLPKKLYEDLGAKDAGLRPGEGGNRSSVTIIVQPATAPGTVDPLAGVKVVDGESQRME